jgi:hypothetical protein
MVERAKSETDLRTLAYAHVNYLGHRNILPQSYLDLMLKKALEIGHPETMIETFQFHSELLCHPHPSITMNYLNFFANKDYASLKNFFEVTKEKYILVKNPGFHSTIIDKAFENKDYKTVVEAYVDTLNYD